MFHFRSELRVHRMLSGAERSHLFNCQMLGLRWLSEPGRQSSSVHRFESLDDLGFLAFVPLPRNLRVKHTALGTAILETVEVVSLVKLEPLHVQILLSSVLQFLLPFLSLHSSFLKLLCALPGFGSLAKSFLLQVFEVQDASLEPRHVLLERFAGVPYTRYL